MFNNMIYPLCRSFIGTFVFHYHLDKNSDLGNMPAGLVMGVFTLGTMIAINKAWRPAPGADPQPLHRTIHANLSEASSWRSIQGYTILAYYAALLTSRISGLSLPLFSLEKIFTHDIHGTPSPGNTWRNLFLLLYAVSSTGFIGQSVISLADRGLDKLHQCYYRRPGI